MKIKERKIRINKLNSNPIQEEINNSITENENTIKNDNKGLFFFYSINKYIKLVITNFV